MSLYIYIYIHTHMCVCIYIYIERERYTCMYIYIYISTRWQELSASPLCPDRQKHTMSRGLGATSIRA